MHAWAPETDAPVSPRVPSDDTVDTVPEKQGAALYALFINATTNILDAVKDFHVLFVHCKFLRLADSNVQEELFF